MFLPLAQVDNFQGSFGDAAAFEPVLSLVSKLAQAYGVS